MTMTVTERSVILNGAIVAGVTVVDRGTEVSMHIHIAGGRVPSSARREIVEQAFSVPGFDRPRPLQATVPLGDPELIAGLSRHLDPMYTRAAGSTCLVEGIVATEDTR